MRSVLAATQLLFASLVSAQPFEMNVQQIQEGHGGSYAIVRGNTHKGANIDIIEVQRSIILYIYTYHPTPESQGLGDELWLSGAASFDDALVQFIPEDPSSGSLRVEFAMFRGADGGTFDGTAPVELGDSVGTATLVWTGPQCDEPRLMVDFVLNGVPQESPPGGWRLQRLTQDDGCCLGCVINADANPQIDPGWRDDIPGWEYACPLSFADDDVPGGLPVHVQGSDGQDICLMACQ